jgi:SAM-dependent methyltransferase
MPSHPDPHSKLIERDPPPGTSLSIRGEYDSHGVEAYYRRFGHQYRNPHEPAVVRSLTESVRRWPLDLSRRVLDLAAGSGEATLALRELGAGAIDATDPFTHAAYAARTGRACERLGFEDVAAGALAGRSYGLIVCSFALHLCEPSRLPGVAAALSLLAPSLLVLTPHKRPVLRPEWGWAPAGEFVVERVRTRWYRSAHANATPVSAP